MQIGGQLHIATDWQNYAEHIEEVMNANKNFIRTVAPARPMTKFAARGERLGHGVWDFCYTLRT